MVANGNGERGFSMAAIYTLHLGEGAYPGSPLCSAVMQLWCNHLVESHGSCGLMWPLCPLANSVDSGGTVPSDYCVI